LFECASYIVLHVPSPAADMVTGMRRRFDPVRADMAVEISVTGSCGVGSIAPGQDPEMIFNEVDRVAAEIEPFEASFLRICRFRNTGIYYFSLSDHERFENLHRRLAESQVKFLPNPWPYEPHCTLKLRGNMTDEEENELLTIELPQNRFLINTLSVYELDTPLTPQLRHRHGLGIMG